MISSFEYGVCLAVCKPIISLSSRGSVVGSWRLRTVTRFRGIEMRMESAAPTPSLTRSTKVFGISSGRTTGLATSLRSRRLPLALTSTRASFSHSPLNSNAVIVRANLVDTAPAVVSGEAARLAPFPSLGGNRFPTHKDARRRRVRPAVRALRTDEENEPLCDEGRGRRGDEIRWDSHVDQAGDPTRRVVGVQDAEDQIDRKSTRLNSSHGYISYAVFCLKKKKNTKITLS